VKFCSLPTAAVLFLAAVFPLRAEWRLESSRRFGADDGPVAVFQKTVSDGQTLELRLVVFDSKKCALRVIDNPGGGDLAAAMEKAGCFAGVNGNYFHPDRTPLGLVISDGKMLHPLEQAKLLSGVLVVTRGGLSLLRTAEYRPDSKITQALQAGPLLVDRGAAVPGLNDTRRAERTVVLSDGRGHGALLVCCGPVTLAGMARILSSPGVISELRVVRAFNLDGGSSTAFWVKEPPFYRREFKTVRNFLGVSL
jgi:uncharacterized protein YigE (DUF2233 family)